MRTTAPHSRAVFVAAGVVTVIATTAVGPSAAAPHTRPVVETWVAQTRERGLDGAALLAEARALVAKYGQGVA